MDYTIDKAAHLNNKARAGMFSITTQTGEYTETEILDDPKLQIILKNALGRYLNEKFIDSLRTIFDAPENDASEGENPIFI